MRIRTHHLVAAVAATAILIVSGAAFAAQGDCSQPVSSGTNPTASDCLFILKAAVGAVQCTLGTPPGCVCEPTGGNRIVATDALLCLKKAVGQGVTLNCPCSTGGPKCSSGKLVSVAGTKLDSGWNGIAHDTDLIEGASVTFEVVRRCSNDSSVCKIDTDCTGGATCDLTCDCDSQNDTVCEISGPTHEQRCLVSLALCNSNADCAGAAGGECVRFFRPPLGLSAGGTPARLTSAVVSPRPTHSRHHQSRSRHPHRNRRTNHSRCAPARRAPPSALAGIPYRRELLSHPQRRGKRRAGSLQHLSRIIAQAKEYPVDDLLQRILDGR